MSQGLQFWFEMVQIEFGDTGQRQWSCLLLLCTMHCQKESPIPCGYDIYMVQSTVDLVIAKNKDW